MVSLLYLHVCYLVLFPVEPLHLVLFQLLSGLHILVIVTLNAKNRFAWSSNGAAHRHRFSNSPPSALPAKCSSYRVVFQLSLVQVDDVGAHAVQEVLRVRDEHEDSLEPENKERDERCVPTVCGVIEE